MSDNHFEKNSRWSSFDSSRRINAFCSTFKLCLWMLISVCCCMPVLAGETSNFKEILSVDFKKEFPANLSKPWGNAELVKGKSDSDNCLCLREGDIVKTGKIPYNGGKIKVSLDLKLTDMIPGKVRGEIKNYRVCRIHVSWYKGEDAKSCSHSDIIVTKKASDWTHINKTLYSVIPEIKYFKLVIFNAAKKGTFWVDNINISIEKKQRNLLGDPSFEYKGRLGADYWFTPKKGLDWDKLTLFSKGAICEITDNEKVAGESSLHLKGNVTVASERFINEGSEIFLSGWIKTKNIVRGKTKWCQSGIQIVYYDEKDIIIGHDDLKLLQGNNKWKRYEWSKILPRRMKSFEIWIRIFEGASGEAWFDDIELYQSESSAKAYNPQTASVFIDANTPEKTEINPVWANGVILYPGRILHPIGQRNIPLLSGVGIKSLRTFECLQDGRVLKKIDDNGNPVYDWTRLDKSLDSLVNNGIVPLMTIECTPNQISSKPDKNNNVYTNKYPPKDYDLWGRIVEDMLVHIVERYGKENVSQWHFDIWNEPEAHKYFKGSLEEYLKIYDQALDALLRVEKKFNIKLQKGTMSSAGQRYFRPLFEHLKAKGTLKHVDYLSFHIYAGTKGAFGNYAKLIEKAMKTRDSYEELKGKPLLITEYNGNSMPGDVYKNKHVIASMVVKCARVFLDYKIKKAYYHAVQDFKHKKTKDFHFYGGGGLITQTGVPKASFNAMKLLGNLSDGRRVPLKTSNEPIDGIAVVSKESLKIILTSFDDSDLDAVKSADVSVKINWKDIKKDQLLKARIIKIDREHGDAYTEFEKLGSPLISSSNNQQNIKRMLKAAKLKEESFNDFKIKNGKLEFNLKMPRNSVVFIKFSPED